ncbi:MAG: hypothetical protein NXY59_04735 [Aigarchaeota archaeon]|nr:hypothetical protein [Candidatus Pelearchaeum maunauluense]
MVVYVSLSMAVLAHGRGFLIPRTWAGPGEETLYAIHVTAEKAGVASFRLMVPEGFRISLDDVIRKWDCECFTDEQGFVKALNYAISIPKNEYVEFDIFTAKNPDKPGKYRWILIVTYADGSKEIFEQDLWIAGAGNNLQTQLNIIMILLILLLVGVVGVLTFILRRRKEKIYDKNGIHGKLLNTRKKIT